MFKETTNKIQYKWEHQYLASREDYSKDEVEVKIQYNSF